MYAWRDDLREENNLASQHPEVVNALQKMLERWREEHKAIQDGEAEENWPMDPAVGARLKALGYIE